MKPSGPRCPICKKPLAGDKAGFAPFCSERCKQIDLAAWLDGNYRISRPAEPEDLEGRPRGEDQRVRPEDIAQESLPAEVLIGRGRGHKLN